MELFPARQLNVMQPVKVANGKSRLVGILHIGSYLYPLQIALQESPFGVATLQYYKWISNVHLPLNFSEIPKGVCIS